MLCKCQDKLQIEYTLALTRTIIFPFNLHFSIGARARAHAWVRAMSAGAAAGAGVRGSMIPPYIDFIVVVVRGH